MSVGVKNCTNSDNGPMMDVCLPVSKILGWGGGALPPRRPLRAACPPTPPKGELYNNCSDPGTFMQRHRLPVHGRRCTFPPPALRRTGKKSRQSIKERTVKHVEVPALRSAPGAGTFFQLRETARKPAKTAAFDLESRPKDHSYGILQVHRVPGNPGVTSCVAGPPHFRSTPPISALGARAARISTISRNCPAT
eukprot:gene16826-biopygen11334